MSRSMRLIKISIPSSVSLNSSAESLAESRLELVSEFEVLEFEDELVLDEDALLPLFPALNFPYPSEKAVPLASAVPLPTAYPFFKRLSDCR